MMPLQEMINFLEEYDIAVQASISENVKSAGSMPLARDVNRIKFDITRVFQDDLKNGVVDDEYLAIVELLMQGKPQLEKDLPEMFKRKLDDTARKDSITLTKILREYPNYIGMLQESDAMHSKKSGFLFMTQQASDDKSLLALLGEINRQLESLNPDAEKLKVLELDLQHAAQDKIQVLIQKAARSENDQRVIKLCLDILDSLPDPEIKTDKDESPKSITTKKPRRM